MAAMVTDAAAGAVDAGVRALTDAVRHARAEREALGAQMTASASTFLIERRVRTTGRLATPLTAEEDAERALALDYRAALDAEQAAKVALTRERKARRSGASER